MKFGQRVAVVVGLLLMCAGLYLMVPKRHRKAFHLRALDWGQEDGSHLQTDPKFNQDLDEGVCTITADSSSHHAEITTYDLFASTKFNTKANGEWEMPEPSPEQLEKTLDQGLTVILMPHSHNDPGWLRTVTEYYLDQTKPILDNMVNKLTQYPDMTFVWAEMSLFSMWWNGLDDAVKVHVRRLVRRGQLELVTGGWVMPDEASTHYTSVIDQLVEGHQWLATNLGVRPNNVWSIDPFGHSGTMPYLWREAGMSHMVIQRVHQAVKASLYEGHALEFYWRQAWGGRQSQAPSGSDNPSGGTEGSDILCHVMPFVSYEIKSTCGPNPHVCQRYDFRPNPRLMSSGSVVVREVTAESVAKDAEILVGQYRAKAAYFSRSVVLIPIGDDFRYDTEAEWDQQYNNYAKLLEYINAQQDWNINVRWGTLKDYFKEVKQQPGVIPSLSGDFFPYSDKDMAYWTGYYSTRPFDKAFSRDVQALLQTADMLNTLSYALYKQWGLLDQAKSRFFQLSSLLQQSRRMLGLFLHHDAITGTAKDFVAEDYEENLLTSLTQCEDVVRRCVQALLSHGSVESPVVFRPVVIRSDHRTIPTDQLLPTKGATTVALINPLGQFRKEMIRLFVDSPKLRVVCSKPRGPVLALQINPVWVDNEDGAVAKVGVYELLFSLTLEPFSIITVILTRQDNDDAAVIHYPKLSVYNSEVLMVPPNLPFIQHRPRSHWQSPIVVSNGVIELSMDAATGSLLTLTSVETGHVTRLESSFQFYTSHGSGAYLFSPSGPASPLYPMYKKSSRKKKKALFPIIPIIKVIEGELATAVDIVFEPHVRQRITLYKQPEHMAGAVFIQNQLAIHMLTEKEVVMRFDTSIQNNDTSFYTDQNGFQFIRRRNLPHLAIEANYYPMTSAMIVEDNTTRLTLLSGQSHGVTSLRTGQLEVMLDRQLVFDDNRGLGEGIRDIKKTISRFILLVEPREIVHTKPAEPRLWTSLSLAGLTLQDSLLQPVVSYFTTIDTDVFFHSVSFFKTSPLPCDVVAVSLRSLAMTDLSYNSTTLVLHRRGYDCNVKPVTSAPLMCRPSDSQLSLASLFSSFSISDPKQMCLTSTTVKKILEPAQILDLKPMQLYTVNFKL